MRRTPSASSTTAPFAGLLDVIRAATRNPVDWDTLVELITEGLRGNVPSAQDVLALVPEHARQGHAESQILHVEPDGSFSVVALVAAPGHATSIHDHTTWCVVAVASGTVTEDIFELDDHGRTLRAAGSSSSSQGAVSGTVPPGDIHRVTNTGDAVSVSLHVYGTDIRRIGTSVRRTYELPTSTTVHEREGVRPDVP